MKFRSILNVLLIFRELLICGNAQENFIGVGAGFGERLEVETVERWPSEELTWEAWVRLDGWNKLQPILTISAGEFSGSLVSGWRSENFEAPAHWRSSQLAFFRNSEWDGGEPLWVSDVALISQEWFHLAVTISNKEIKVSVDGQLMETGFSPTLISWDKLAGHRMRFGFGETRDRDGSLHVFTGALDEVRLWTRVRSPRELRSTMMLRLTGEEPGMLGRWDLDGPKSSPSNPKHVVTRNASLHPEFLAWESIRRSSANLESTAPLALTSKLTEGRSRSTKRHFWTLAAYGPDESRLAVWRGEMGSKASAPHSAIQEVQSIHHYEAFVEGNWIGSWNVDGNEIANGLGDVDFLEGDRLVGSADFGKIRSMESAPLRVSLDWGAFNGFDRLSDGRIAATGEQGVFWWDGSQFHSLFPEHFKVEKWVEIFDSVFLLEVGTKWIAYSEMSGVCVEWVVQEDVLGSNVWESDGSGTLWVALQDKTLEMTLGGNSVEGFWKSLAFEGTPSATGIELQWKSKIISPLASLQMAWTASSASLWALTESGLFCYSKSDEEGRFISDESGERFLSGKFQIASFSDVVLWVATHKALFRIQESGDIIESFAWPTGFNEMFSSAGRIWIAPGPSGDLWALNEMGVLAYRRGDHWVTMRLQDVSFSSTPLKLVALDSDSVWVLDKQNWRRFSWVPPVLMGSSGALAAADLNDEFPSLLNLDPGMLPSTTSTPLPAAQTELSEDPGLIGLFDLRMVGDVFQILRSNQNDKKPWIAIASEHGCWFAWIDGEQAIEISSSGRGRHGPVYSILVDPSSGSGNRLPEFLGLDQVGVFRMRIPDYRNGIRLRNLETVLDGSSRRGSRKFSRPKRDATTIGSEPQMLIGSKLFFEAHAFSDTDQFEPEFDTLIWLARWKDSSSFGSIKNSVDDPGWELDLSELSSSSESKFFVDVDGRIGWIPDRPGYYKVTAAKRRWDGALVESNPIYLRAVAPWYLEPLTKTLVWALTAVILAGLVYFGWVGYRAAKTLPAFKNLIASLEVKRRELEEELSHEQKLQEDVIQRLVEKERDLKEVRFELIGRLHEEIRPLLELSLPEHSEVGGDSSKLGDPEFKDKVREALQFLSDLCLVELDHQEGDINPGHAESFSLHELLSELERWFKETCQYKKIQFRTVIQLLTTSVENKGGTDSKLKADQIVYGPFDQIRSILFHLASNAVHHTSQGEALVSLRLTPKLGAGTPEEVFLEVEVLDTGEGIDQEEMRRICEPGYRGKNSRSNWRPGTGSGLFLTRKVLEDLGSKLEVESLPGAGSRFRFKLTVFLPQISEAQSNSAKTGKDLAKEQQGETLTDKQLQEVRNAEESSALLWMEIELQVQYGAWQEVALLILRLKKLPNANQDQLQVFSSIVLRKGREEALDWLKSRNKSS